MEGKPEIRRRIRGQRQKLAEETVISKSRAVLAQLMRSNDFASARRIMFYFDHDNEIKTEKMIKEALKEGKEVFLPRISDDPNEIVVHKITNLDEDTAVGAYGIVEPKADRAQECDPISIDLFIVPAVAFARSGDRLGRGAGYYDKFFGSFKTDALRIGLSYDFQVLDYLPSMDHDMRVDKIITESQVIICKKELNRKTREETARR